MNRFKSWMGKPMTRDEARVMFKVCIVPFVCYVVYLFVRIGLAVFG